MTFDVEDTIVAIASAPGSSVRGIVRISGPATLDCIARNFSADPELLEHQLPLDLENLRSQPSRPSSWNVRFNSISGLSGRLLVWPGNKSYTRQPTAEFHTIGSPPLLECVVEDLCQSTANDSPTVRMANAGEFTLRAFLGGRIDLTQAEAVLAVIDADSDSQLNTALEQLAGGLAGPLGKLRTQLLDVLAELEAGLDFVEEDIEFITQEVLNMKLGECNDQLKSILAQVDSRNLRADHTRVVLFGLPNSGKSSLFNLLTGKRDAIVTDISGTTTDFISARIEIDAVLIELIDTAGFESRNDKIGKAAQDHREQQQSQAELGVLCVDGSRSWESWELNAIENFVPELIVLTKSDLPTFRASLPNGLNSHVPTVSVSSKDAGGKRELEMQLVEIITGTHVESNVVGSTIARASESLRDSSRSLERALEINANQMGEELVAAEIRQALQDLGYVVGTIYTDDILDLVFGRFCIGK